MKIGWQLLNTRWSTKTLRWSLSWSPIAHGQRSKSAAQDDYEITESRTVGSTTGRVTRQSITSSRLRRALTDSLETLAVGALTGSTGGRSAKRPRKPRWSTEIYWPQTKNRTNCFSRCWTSAGTASEVLPSCRRGFSLFRTSSSWILFDRIAVLEAVRTLPSSRAFLEPF